jgi:hypothetical protein
VTYDSPDQPFAHSRSAFADGLRAMSPGGGNGTTNPASTR